MSEDRKPTDAAFGLSSTEALARLQQDGPNEIPEKKPHLVLMFLSKFWGLSAWMVELIAILSVILHKTTDFAVALALLIVNALLSFLQEQRASAAVVALRKRLQVAVRVLRDGGWVSLPPSQLARDDVIRLRTGDIAPADGKIVDGSVEVDQSSLTGESREIAKKTDDTIFSGSVVKEGEATALIVATGSRTYYGRTTELVQSAHPKLHIDEVVSRLVRWLFVIVGIEVAVAFAVALTRGFSIVEILPLTLVLLMSAIPVALPVMFTVSMALGSVALAKRGVLVTRLSAAEDVANMDVLCVDKTGTLTMNKLALSGTLPQPGFLNGEVLRDGASASNDANQDAIDVAFLEAVRKHSFSESKTLSFTPFSAKTRHTEAVVDRGGKRYRVIKGALRTVAAAAGLDEATIRSLEQRAAEEAQKGNRAIAVARAENGGPLRLVGIALLADRLRPDSRRLLDELRSLGIAVKMLTGDAIGVATETARMLGLGKIVRAVSLHEENVPSVVRDCDGFAEIYPEDKFVVVKALQAAGHVVGMTGDGVNDAPALKQAEVGIAVSSATDVAKGAASVVLTGTGLKEIVALVKNGRATYQRVLTWIVNKISRTILKSGFVVVAFLVTGKFVISALGMVLLVFMTDFVKVALATDRVRPSLLPESWNIGPLVRIAVILGLLMLLESLALLAFCWHRLGIGDDSPKLQTFSFQTLLFFALFSLVSIRERRFFWSSSPSLVLAAALIGDACAGILIGAFGLAEMRPMPLIASAFVVGYAFVCCLGLNDLIKWAMVRSHRPVHPSQATLPV